MFSRLPKADSINVKTKHTAVTRGERVLIQRKYVGVRCRRGNFDGIFDGLLTFGKDL